MMNSKNINNVNSMNNKMSADTQEIISVNGEGVNVVKHKRIKKKQKKINDVVEAKPASVDAFKILMGAQKRVIGTNSPGKECNDVEESADKSFEKDVKIKRKLFLTKWAESKGAGEKKLIEAEHEKKAKRTLIKRKVDFTNMLLNKKTDDDSNKRIKKKSIIARKYKNNISDSDSDSEFVNKKVCLQNVSSADNDEFVKNLAPSMKKKENVLSYFTKLPKTDLEGNCKTNGLVDTVAEKENVIKIKSKKVRTKKKNSKREVEPSEDSIPLSNLQTIENNDNCVDESYSVRNKSNRSKKKIVKYAESDSDVNIISDESILIAENDKKLTQIVYFDEESQTLFIEDDNVTDASSCKSSEAKKVIVNKNTKMAPLFVKKSSKQSIDPTIAAARHKFLYSESPMITEKQTEVELPETIFPEISHIQQIPSASDSDFYIWNLPQISMKYNEISDIPSSGKTKFFGESIFNINDASKNRNISELFQLFKISDHKEILIRLKDFYPKFPIYKTFRQLKEKFDNANQISDINSLPELNKNENSLWTDKYKPSSSDDIIGNFKSIATLKKWLLSWKECSQDMSNKLRTFKDDTSSSDDFLTSDSESDDATLPHNTTIIFGPKGSGKTSAIYAIANELDINVLEVNASSKRTGKRIMTELQEATQSHKLSTKKKSHDPLKTSSKLVNGSKSKKRKIDKSKKQFFNSDVNSKDLKKMSLMLIDDADIIFDEDDGFISAINQIISISKRPIIIITSDLKCNHLKKIISDNSVVKFSPLQGKIIGPWLDVMLLVECGKYFPNLTSRLVDYNGGDVRLTMHQLQFWLANKDDIWKGIDAKSEQVSEDNNLEINEDSNMSWKEVNYTSTVKDNINQDNAVIEILEKISNFPDVPHIYESGLNEISDLSDVYSFMDLLESYDDVNQRISPWSIKLSNSISEFENNHIYNANDILNNDIIDQNIKLSRDIYGLKKQTNSLDERLEEIRWTNKHHFLHSRLASSIPVSSQLDRRGLTLDYMPSLRNICRTEKYRSESNIKRNNRFYHYVRSLNVNINESIYNNACEVLNMNFE